MRIKLLDLEMMPFKKYDQDAGWDLRARDSCSIYPDDALAIKTGVCVEIPPGFSGEIRPRSSITKRGLIIPLGTIDSQYRGEIEIIVLNPFSKRQIIERGERIAQLVITPCMLGTLEIVDELSVSQRGASGFGSTGRL
ncbi:dUTP diphosphatase [Candidatus Pacearchaeota archaeon]|jgi:dUTP pyrophosphatase|nr:dUTP diphosphatase [Candidatus Pacearchaeota archaeon]